MQHCDIMTLSLLFLLMTASGTTLAQTSNSSTPTQASNSATENYALPIYDTAPLERQQQIAANQQGYVYAQSLLGNLSFFLTGKLGDALVATGVELFAQEADIFGSIIETEAQEVIAAVSKVWDTSGSLPVSTDRIYSGFQCYPNVEDFWHGGTLILHCVVCEPMAVFKPGWGRSWRVHKLYPRSLLLDGAPLGQSVLAQ
jgi:hypothetical protein